MHGTTMKIYIYIYIYIYIFPSLSKFHFGIYIPKSCFCLLYDDIFCPNKWRWNLLRYDKTDEYIYIYIFICCHVHVLAIWFFPYGWMSDRYLWNISLTWCECRMPAWVIFQLHIENKYQNYRGYDIWKEGNTTFVIWESTDFCSWHKN